MSTSDANPAEPEAEAGAERVIRIGSRASPMALAQVERVSAELRARTPRLRVEVVGMTTAGDRWSGSLAAFGGKGAFTREVDAALLAGTVDLAVHCMKDVPGDIPVPAGTAFAGYPTRDDARDALVHPGGLRLDELPAGTRIGTSAVRRVAQLARDHPHLETVPIRGNANTRLAKLDAGEVDALMLAVAGLERIGAADRISEVLPVEVMTPAVGAGVLGLQCREDDAATIDLVSEISDPVTWQQITAERIMLHVLQGHCNAPIAGHATTSPDGNLTLTGAVYSLDGKTTLTVTETAPTAESTTLGTSVALSLLRQGASALIAAASP